jgi:hypothetical protein
MRQGDLTQSREENAVNQKGATMAKRLRNKLNYSNVIATIALFTALGGAAVAAGLPKRSVGTRQLKPGAVTTFTLRRNAVTKQKLARGAVVSAKLAVNSVRTGALQNGSVNAAKLARNSVTGAALTNGVVGTGKLRAGAVTTGKLANGAVNTGKLANGSVTLGKLADDVAPLVGTLKTGQTLRGVFDVGGKESESARSAVSYQFPLLNAPAVNVLLKGETNANCAGLSGGNEQTPQATPGNLCIYITEASAATTLAAENNTRLGFGLKVDAVLSDVFAYGQWAVTAP